MKFSTAKEHRDFFQKHGWIEFEGLVSNDQLTAANQAMDEVLAERLHVTSDRLRLQPSEKLFLQGRDLWRSNPLLQKLATQIRFAEIVAELIEKKPLRLGYDQFLPARQAIPLAEGDSNIYSRFLERTAPLQAVSCLQGVACGLMISLGGKEQEAPSEKSETDGIDIFPNQPGNVIFFQPKTPIHWGHLYEHAGQRFYLIVYTFAQAHYHLEPQDPHTHALKRLGYVFNDKLTDRLNPIVYR